jgi:hypothetical protein
MVNRGDRRVGPLAFGFRRKIEDNQARQQATETHHQGQQPGAAHPDNRRAAFTARAWRQIPDEPTEKELGRPLDREIEDDRAEPGHQADARAQQQPFG